MDTTSTSTLTRRKSTLIPPGAMGWSKIARLIDALRSDTRLSAGAEYQTMVDALLPSVTGINDTAEQVLHDDNFVADAVLKGSKWGKGPSAGYRNLGPQLLGTAAVSRISITHIAVDEFTEVDGLVAAWNTKWLFDGDEAPKVIWTLITINARGIDPIAIDRERAGRSDTWQTAYGSNKSRISRGKHRELMRDLKADGWTFEKPSKTAKDWVEAHHVYKGQADWILNSDDPTYQDEPNVSRAFKPFWNALGVKRGPGRPKAV